MIECIDKQEVYSVNFLDSVRFVHKAWERIIKEKKTIRNFFRHAGIIQEVSTEIECSIATTEEDEDDLTLSEWMWKIDSINFA